MTIKSIYIYSALAVLALLSTSHIRAQQADSTKVKELEGLVVSGSKNAVQRQQIIRNITILNRSRIQQLNTANTCDLLQQSGEVFIQKSQSNGGSPIVRGFEASRILLVIDGVRLNNAIYRSGHLQNISTVDQNILERIEVLHGPSSALHGSDALGGVIVMQSLEPIFAKPNKKLFKGSAMVRYASAIREQTAHTDMRYAKGKFAGVTSITFSNFGKVRAGKNIIARDTSWGKNYFYAGRTVSGLDTTLPNANPFVLQKTGFRQIDVLQKIAYKQGYYTHMLNLQLSTTSNINRYDRLSEIKNGKMVFAEWYYGPQMRTLTCYTLKREQKYARFAVINANIAHQKVQESRITRRFANNDKFMRIENIDVWSYDINGTTSIRKHSVTIGTDAQFNDLKSVGKKENITTGQVMPSDSRYPNGKNFMGYFNVYAQHIFAPQDKIISINSGLRLSSSSLSSTIANPAIQFNMPYTEIKQRTAALNSNLAVKARLHKNLTVSTIFSEGFRAPNIDDMAKIFETQSGVAVHVPNPNIKPEKTRNLELNAQFLNNNLKVETGVYRTWMRNAFVIKPFSFNGKDSILYNGVLLPTVAAQNSARATINGFYVNVQGKIVHRLSYSGNLSLARGMYSDGNLIVPLDHIPPTFGRVGIIYNRQKWYCETFTHFADLKPLSQYSPSGEDNAQYATSVGMPSWYTINMRAGVTVLKQVQLSVGVENIMDVHYRYFASGISAPGRNLLLTARSNF